MEQLTEKQKKQYKEALLRKTYQGDAIAAFNVFGGYNQGKDGFEKDVDKSFEYLKISADLGFPQALDAMKSIYGGTDILGIKKEQDLKKYINYLEMLSISDQIFDYNSVKDEKWRNKFYTMEWEAYAELGRLYITIPQLYAQDNRRGFTISLYVAEKRGLAESLYALGYYFDCYRPPQYTPSETLLKKRGNLGMALYYYERAINTDNSRYANLAFDAYNQLAEYINVEECRTEENMIPYYRR